MMPDFKALGEGFDRLLSLLERIAIALETIALTVDVGPLGPTGKSKVRVSGYMVTREDRE